MGGLKDTDPEFAETDRLMHVLWTRAVGTADYNKKDWIALEAAIARLARRAVADKEASHGG
jgi:hypothetical protein